jgi:hypothetical protein
LRLLTSFVRVPFCSADSAPPFLNVTLFSFSLTSVIPTPSDSSGAAALWSKLQSDVAFLTGAEVERVYLVDISERRETDPHPDIQYLSVSSPSIDHSRKRRLDHRITRREGTEFARTAAETSSGHATFRTLDLELARITLCFLPALFLPSFTTAASVYEDTFSTLLQRWRDGLDTVGAAGGLARGNITQFIHAQVPMDILPSQILLNCDSDFQPSGILSSSSSASLLHPYLAVCPEEDHHVYWGLTGLTIAVVLGLFFFLVLAFTVWYFYNRQLNRLRRGEIKYVKPEYRAIVFGSHNTRFKQHTLDAWQPVWKPREVSLGLLVLGLGLLFPLGVWFAVDNSRLVEAKVRYDNLPECDMGMGKTSCTVNIPIPHTMRSPVYFYYHLSNFYQNHRAYVESRSDAQLRDDEKGAPARSQECRALEKFGDWPAEDAPRSYPFSADTAASLQDKILYPCGLIASSFFTDTFPSASVTSSAILDAMSSNSSFPGPPSFPLEGRNWQGEGIAWTTDRESRFKARAVKGDETQLNPRGVPRNHPNDIAAMTLPSVSDEDFIVWMRTAPFSTFSKFNKHILDRSLRKGEVVSVHVQLGYDVSGFSGEKSLVLSTSSATGSSNVFLGVAYLVMACVYMLTSLVLYLVYRRDIDPISPDETLQLAMDAQAEADESDAFKFESSNAPIFNARLPQARGLKGPMKGSITAGAGGKGSITTLLHPGKKNQLIMRHAQ